MRKIMESEKKIRLIQGLKVIHGPIEKIIHLDTQPPKIFPVQSCAASISHKESCSEPGPGQLLLYE